MSVRWYIARQQQKLGPFSAVQLKQLAECGFVQPREYVWVEGASKWVEANSVPGLFPAADETKYWLRVNGQTRGPYVPDQIEAGLTTRQFNMDTQVYSDKIKKWLPLSQVTELRDFVPGSVSHSQAQLLASSLDLEEARLHLAGKEGDELAGLLSHLLDMRRTHENRPELVKSLDRSIALLKERRASSPPRPVP
jgi:hypothetical protein